jgi:peptidoglycan/LPS O-acetylase OafA/YrhL
VADSKLVAGRPSRSAGYLPTLDGWRTIAIVGVIFNHASHPSLGPFPNNWFYHHGNLGVDVFFAISGLLICSRLLNEEESTGRISLRNFYIRRAFRILPPAIFFLLTLLVLKYAVQLQVSIAELLASLFFVHNYTSLYRHFLSFFPFYTSHFWSLAVEEHFYFMLPPLLVLIPSKWRVQSLLLLAVMFSLHRIHSGTIASVQFHTGNRIDALIVPALFAVLLRKPHVRELFKRWLAFWPVIALFLLTIITFWLIPRAKDVLVAWLTPLLIMGTMLRPQSWFSRFLELPPMRYIGRLSYSLYLWQQLFIVTHFLTDPTRLHVLQTWPVSFLMTAACALLSYYFIEQPFIHIGHRLAPNVTVNAIARSETA